MYYIAKYKSLEVSKNEWVLSTENFRNSISENGYHSKIRFLNISLKEYLMFDYQFWKKYNVEFCFALDFAQIVT